MLGFVGRRLLAEPVGLLLAVREAAGERLFPGLPALTLEGLTDEDARALLTAAVPGHLDNRVRDRIIAETGGNPLGLLELARGMSEAELAGGFADPPKANLPGHLQGRLQDHYLRRVQVLPGPAQQLMLLAAADPTGDATLLWRAAQKLGLGPDAAAAADAEQLLNIGSQVRFRHPLVRSAAYAAGSPEDRRAAHLTLAAATDAQADPERRVWHLAAAATGPDEDVAAALEQAAAKIQARAGLAASAAFLQRSVTLTAEPGRHTERALAAALAHLHAGAFDTALGLLARAEAHAVDDLQRARVEQLRGQIEWASVTGREAPVLLLQAARRLESLDAGLARETYLYAWVASHLAGPLAGPGGLLLEVSRAAQAAPQPAGAPRPCDLLLDGLTTMIIQGRAAAEPTIRRAVDAFLGDQVSGEEWLQWGIFAQMAAMAVWDFDSWVALSTRHVELARASGALAPLSIALNGRGSVATHCGDFETATSLAAEKDVVNEVTGIRLATTCDLLLAGYRGRPAEAVPLFTATTEDSTARGEGLAVQMANWSAAVLHNGLGRYAEALAVAEPATEETYSPLSTQLVLPELIEAAVRTGRADLAREALGRLSAMTAIEGSDWAKGLEARSRALVSEGREAEQCYAEAVERLGRTPLRPDLARAHLLYGEWLRRENRRLDARHQLHAAYHLLDAIGAEAFAERARRELLATGEKVRKREVDTLQPAHPAGGAHRPAGPRRTHQPRDRRGTIHQHPHRRMAPAQGVRQTGHHLPPGPPQHLCPREVSTRRPARSLVPHWGRPPSCPYADQGSARARRTWPRRDRQSDTSSEGGPHVLVIHRPRRPGPSPGQATACPATFVRATPRSATSGCTTSRPARGRWSSCCTASPSSGTPGGSRSSRSRRRGSASWHPIRAATTCHRSRTASPPTTSACWPPTSGT